jgi:C4-type Zn-finger protein
MGIVIYGTKIVPVGVDESFVKCPVCESHQHADVMVESHYYHLYWIPVFPYDKTATIICQNCGLKRTSMEISENWFSDYREIKKRNRHPLYSYIGVAFIALVIALVIIDPD